MDCPCKELLDTDNQNIDRCPDDRVDIPYSGMPFNPDSTSEETAGSSPCKMSILNSKFIQIDLEKPSSTSISDGICFNKVKVPDDYNEHHPNYVGLNYNNEQLCCKLPNNNNTMSIINHKSKSHKQMNILTSCKVIDSSKKKSDFSTLQDSESTPNMTNSTFLSNADSICNTDNMKDLGMKSLCHTTKCCGQLFMKQ